jgi:transcriptional regulator with XRE-family HTH domain
MSIVNTKSVGDLLREWRQRRRLSQLDLALESEISTKHLSFIETGRATPSREMLLHLAECLMVPLREQNVLLVAAGYAPIFPEHSLDAPELHAARQAVDLVLKGHEPYPALAIDRHWNLVAANSVLPKLLFGLPAELTQAPINVVRLSLHPAGLAPNIVDYPSWYAHVVGRLRQQIEISADPILVDLYQEVSAYPMPHNQHRVPDQGQAVVPFELQTAYGLLSFITTTTVFGTPIDITLSELALELFFPTNQATSTIMQQLMEMDITQSVLG